MAETAQFRRGHLLQAAVVSLVVISLVTALGLFAIPGFFFLVFLDEHGAKTTDPIHPWDFGANAEVLGAIVSVCFWAAVIFAMTLAAVKVSRRRSAAAPAGAPAPH